MNITKLTEEEYKELQQRVADGKVYLYEKKRCPSVVSRRDRCSGCLTEPTSCIDTFFDLSDRLMKQMAIRDVFGFPKTRETHLVSKAAFPGETADEYVERRRAELIEKGVFTSASSRRWLSAYKKKKGGAVPKNVQNRSESYSLF